MQTETILKTVDFAKKTSIAICVANISKNKKIHDLKLCDWITNELKGLPVFVFDLKKSDNLKDIIAIYAKNFDKFMLIYSNTPLITKKTVLELFEYVTYKNCTCCKLPNGIIANTSYFLTNKDLFFDSIYSQNQQDFIQIESEEQIAYASKVLMSRIINTHKNNGVIFKNPESLNISYNAKIGTGSIILANCNILGKTTIGKNCIINNNTTIESSKIGDNTSISNSIINKSSIGKDVIVSPYCNIINKSKINDNCYIDYYCLIDNYTVKKNTKINERTTLKKTN